MNKPLVSGKIISQCDRPRSFKIQLNNNKKIERNSRHIYPYFGKDEKFNESLIDSRSNNMYDNCNSNNNQNHNSEADSAMVNLDVQNGSQSDNQNVTNQNSNVCTRSGRIVKTPAYLKDFDCK